ncbi:unnamed protein product [Closterium sp. NIES-54]
MTTLQVLLHVAAQRDYELHSLDFSTAFLQGSLHEEIWLRRPPGFTGSFPPTGQLQQRGQLRLAYVASEANTADIFTKSRPASPVRTIRRAHCPRPPPIPGTHTMALRPSFVPQRAALPSPSASSLPDVPDPESHLARATSPTVTRLLAIDPSFESTVSSALVTELVDFAATCCLDYVASLVTESESVCPPSIGGELSLGCDILEDMQLELECLTAVLPRFASMLLCLEGDPDALDIPTSRTHAEAITGTYIDEVPPPWANIVDGIWIFRVKRPTGSALVFKTRDVARDFIAGSGVSVVVLGRVVSYRRAPALLTRTGEITPFKATAVMATPSVLTFDAQGRAVDFEVWVDDLQLFLQCDRADGLSLFDLTSGASPALPATADSTVRSQWATRDAAARLDELTRYSSPATAALSRLMLPYLFPDLAAFPTVADLITHLRTSDTRYCAALPTDSSCEAVIYAGAMAAQELCWLTYLLTDLGEPPCSPPVLYVDNKAMLALCREQRLEHKTKHIALRYFLSRELQHRGQLRLAYVASQANTADIITKALQPCDHQRFCTMLGQGPVVLTGHSDAWADDQATQQSTQGYSFSLGSGFVSWRSTRSSSVLGSSSEAEIYAGAMAAQELRWLTYLLTDLGERARSPQVLYVDNKAMIAMCRE